MNELGQNPQQRVSVMDATSMAITCAGLVKKVVTILTNLQNAKLQHGEKLDKLELHLEILRDIVLNLQPTDTLYARASKTLHDCEKIIDDHIDWRFSHEIKVTLDWAESFETELKPIRETLDLLYMSLTLRYSRRISESHASPSTTPVSSSSSAQVSVASTLPSLGTSSTSELLDDHVLCELRLC